jgi:hypothetical protein
MKWLYTNGTWAYFCNVFTTPTFILVPFISLMFGIHPVRFDRVFALAAMAYLISTFLVMSYFRWAAERRLGRDTARSCPRELQHVPGAMLQCRGFKAAGTQPLPCLLFASPRPPSRPPASQEARPRHWPVAGQPLQLHPVLHLLQGHLQHPAGQDRPQEGVGLQGQCARSSAGGLLRCWCTDALTAASGPCTAAGGGWHQRR